MFHSGYKIDGTFLEILNPQRIGWDNWVGQAVESWEKMIQWKIARI